MGGSTRLLAVAAIFVATSAAAAPQLHTSELAPVLIGGGTAQPPANAVVLSKSAVLIYAPAAETRPLTARPLVLNRDAVTKFAPTATPAALDALLREIMRNSGATVIVKADMVAAAMPSFDITGAVIDRMKGRRDIINYPQAFPVHLLTIDRDAIIKNSKVYRSVQLQADQFVRTAQEELEQEGDKLADEGTELQEKIPSLSPEDAAAQQAAYDAKHAAFEREPAAREQAIKDAIALVDRKVGYAIEAALDKVMKRTGSQIVLLSSATASMPPAHDATGEVLRYLDEALPDVTLKPRTIPAAP